MSYQVLARKWRSRTFKELVGQAHVLQALVNALDNDRLHHAYLFTGTRGVGKTSIARILAKCLNCEQGVSSNPCGVCSACKEIDEGRFVDLIEVDAASRTRLEDTKELLDNVQYAPTRGRFKVYLIDEVHMLSTHSFNALLKTLEEPPPHIKFLLATTDPHKLPITILSRCLQFSLKNMQPEKVVEHLQHVLDSEKVAYEVPALWQLGRAADGSMRDALSLTDQAIAYCGDKLTSQAVTAMLGTIDQDQVYRVLDALVAGQADAVLDAVGELAEHSPDYVAVLGDMLSALHRIALAQAVPDVVDNSQGDRERILDLAGKVTAEDVQLYYQTGMIGRRDLPLAPDPRAGFEMVLLRMLAFRPDGVPAAPQQALPGGGSADGARRESQSAPATSSTEAHSEPEEPEPRQPEAQPPAPEPAVLQPAAPQPEPEPPAPQQPSEMLPPPWDEAPPLDAYESQPVAEPVREPMPEPVRNVMPESVPAPEPAPAAAPVMDTPVAETVVEVAAAPEPANDAPKIPLGQLQTEDWIPLSQQLGMGGVTGAIVSHCELVSCGGGKLLLRLDGEHDTLYNDNHRQRIQAALKTYFGEEIALDVETGTIATETPAAWRERRRLERLAAARQSFLTDDRVQAIVNAFSGRVLEQTIEPVGS
ncbi:DNA polymerase III subunit gamma/tau [Sansalvadorimonas verongulae]|uniref:DNA polymerase III subunit gamma/tau n=1 Tax=Sansalvadorimonas verongulae TaxID=2172824 RepID=UPI0012BD5F61|nr:DNA polymerase III subunit gamma/tau [Sansalvadorimonas verongulae]MTI12748.1 DNA polymerase III subunit gamma/tau [Sansalvadorimonas verongulae]